MDGAQRTGPVAFRRARGALAAAGLVGATLIAAAAGCEPEVPPWAAGAQEYIDAFDDAFQSGFSNTAPFYVQDATFDGRFLMIPPATGPSAIVQVLRDNFQGVDRDVNDATPLTRDEPLYLSADGAVDPVWMHADPFIVHLATTYALSPDGITSEVWAGQVKGGEMYLGVPISTMMPLAQGYLDAWASSDPAALRARYADDAVVRDSLAGITLEGASAIASAASAPAGAGGLPRATLHQIPGNGGPAFYLDGDQAKWSSAKVDWMVMLVSVDDGSGCPGDMAIAVSLDDEQRITHEERYHRIDSLGRCTTGTKAGWWDTTKVPDVAPVVRTGTMTLAGLDVAIWNGTPDPSPLIEWAVQRFADSGMTPPIPTSVAFLPRGDDPWARYGFAEGSSAPDLALPFPAAQACTDPDCTQWPTWAKAAMLHQLAHLWSRQGPYIGLTRSPRGPSQAATFLREHELAWADEGRPWRDQGSQVAAETIAWGLMDEPYTIDARLGRRSCQQLSSDFTLLARAPADERACADEPPEYAAAGEVGGPDDQYPPPAPAPWVPVEDTRRALTWFSTYASALRQGLGNLPAFYAPEAVIDHRALGSGVAVGQESVLDLLGTQEEGLLLTRQQLHPLHLGADAALAVERITTPLAASVGAFAMTMGPTGIRTETYAPSLQSWRRTFPKDERLLEVQLAVEMYRRAWGEQGAGGVSALYAPQATITDDLLGVDVQGRPGVDRLAGSSGTDGGLPGLAWVSLPDMGGPGIFIAGGRVRSEQLDTVVLLARTNGCLGHLAIVLHLDEAGLIDSETRLHSSDDLSRCPRTRTVAAWWEAVAIPPAVAMVHTGTVNAGDRSIEIFNGSPTLDEFVAWGVDRYADGGLGTPAVDVIRFIGMTTDTCQRVAGLNLGTEITLCVDTSRAAPLPKAVLLHELGHAWMNQNLDQADRARFLRAAGRPTWASTTSLWGDRGVELAASTLSWALMDTPQPLNHKLGAHSCPELAELYEALVGRPPTTAPPCPAGTAGGSTS